MKKVKLFYAKVGNMGDLLNELIVENVLGYEVIHCGSRYKCQSTGIGSFLDKFFLEDSNLPNLPKRLAGKFLDQINSPLQIWSSGFMNNPSGKEYPVRKNIKISSVRGELTRKRLERIMNTKLDVPTGDGGLLASFLIEEKIDKKYRVGIIPHFRERHEQRFKDLANEYDNSILIDLTDDPLNVVKTISQCEVILSSALHGLIVADSFGIPNRRLVFTDKPLGDGYKFNDYYSSFNLSIEPIDLRNPKNPDLISIIDDYKIPYSLVEQKQKQLIESFSKYL